MKKIIRGLLASAVLATSGIGAANAGYTYVGNWIVGDGPIWTSNPTVFSGLSAAAFLFGGAASDYAISTIDNNPLNINHKAFLDGWGDTQYLANPQSESFFVDTGAPGYNDPAGVGTSYSAYILDHTCMNRYNILNDACSGDGVQYVNYAFRITNNVPEPATLALLGFGLAGIGFARRRKAKQVAV